ncbi:MgtC/SapB family protein [Thermoproteota archaeon]
MDLLQLLTNILISIALGILVGLERQHSAVRRKHEPIAVIGIRTFPMASLAGTLIAVLAQGKMLGIEPNSWLLVAGILVHGLFCMAIFWIIFNRRERTGFSTVSAFYIIFIIGILVGYDLWLVAITAAIIVTFLLFFKTTLHGLVNLLTSKEIFSALQFICIAFILYPLSTMDSLFEGFKFIGPGKLFDIQWTVLIMVFVASISFISFLVLRRMGSNKGLLWSGFLGGLVSSAATAASLGNLARKKSFLMRAAFAGIVLTNISMLVRNLLIVGFADQSFSVLKVFIVPCVMMIAVSLGILGYLMKKNGIAKKKELHDLRLSSPFAIKPAIKFALLFSLVSALSYILTTVFGESGVYFTAIGGLVSSTAVSASVATMAASGSISPVTAGITAGIACVLSIVNKIYIVQTVNPALTKYSWKWMLLKGILGLVGIGLLLFML